VADLTGERNRGQILLIAAFALAVTFVALALIVNSAIFTENLASRGETAGGDGALAARAMVEDSVGTSVRSANRHNTVGTDQQASIERDVGRLSRQSERQQITTGGLLNVSRPHSYEMGHRIAMNDSGGGNFTSDGTDDATKGDWQVVRKVRPDGQPHATRAFEMEVKKADLTATDSDRFAVELNNTGSPSRTWRVELWQDSMNPDEIHVEAERPDGATRECVTTVETAAFTVSLTEGTVASEPCVALGYDQSTGTYYGYAGGVTAPYNVSFYNGETVRGNYSFVISDHRSTSLTGPGPGSSPYITPAVYATDVEFMYVNSNINYTAAIRVAPGEPDA